METLRFLMVSTFYPPYHLGGDAVHVQYLAEALAARGHEVHVEFAPSAYRVKRPFAPPPRGSFPDRVQTHPIPDRTGLRVPMGAYLIGRSRTADRHHARLVRETRPDVVHLHNISLLGLGVQSAPNGSPLLFTAHDYWFRCPRSDLLKLGRVPCDSPTCMSCMIRSHRVPALWRSSDIATRLNSVGCVIAPSEFMQKLARDSFRCPVIHLPNFIPDDNPGGVLESEAPYYLYVGVLENHKGMDVLAQAILQYRGTRRFVIVGRGSQEKRLRALAHQVGSKVDVRSWVSQEDLRPLYRHASALLVPSIWFENSPLVAIEALSWGVPLLTTVRGGAPELVAKEMAGFAFEPSASGLLHAIEAFEGLGDREKLRAGARAAYERHHRPEGYLTRYLSVVRALVEHGTPETEGEPGPFERRSAPRSAQEA